eukprot:1158421-Pelagomonas_calceolata.AAC.21
MELCSDGVFQNAQSLLSHSRIVDYLAIALLVAISEKSIGRGSVICQEVLLHLHHSKIALSSWAHAIENRGVMLSQSLKLKGQSLNAFKEMS